MKESDIMTLVTKNNITYVCTLNNMCKLQMDLERECAKGGSVQKETRSDR